VTETEARAALRAFLAVGGIEPWIASRRWQAVPDGRAVAGELQGWRFRLALEEARRPFWRRWLG
jgi:hypothetical protein